MNFFVRDYVPLIFISSDVVLCETSDRVIESRASDVILINVDSIESSLISAFHPRVIMVEI